MGEQQFIAFLTFSLIFYATPGPATLSLAACGAAYGFKRSIGFVAGICVGLSFNLSIVAVGLGYIFRYPVVFTTFKYVSLLYIFYLAYKIATSETVKMTDAKPLSFFQGVLLNLLNPKAYIAAVAVMTQFAAEGEQFTESIIQIVLSLLVMVSVINVTWCYAGNMLSRLFSRPESARRLNILLAVLLVLSVLIATFSS